MTGITAGTGEQRSYVLGRLHERRKKQGERKDIVKEGTELVAKFTTSLGSAATAKEIAYSESSIFNENLPDDIPFLHDGKVRVCPGPVFLHVLKNAITMRVYAF